MMKIKNKLFILTLIFGSFAYQSCDVEPEIYSEIIPEEFFKSPEQFASAASAAYLPLRRTQDRVHPVSDVVTDIATVAVRSNNGWDDGGLWPRLMSHDFQPSEFYSNNVWSLSAEGTSVCNRLIEIFTEQAGADSPAVLELRALRAHYIYLALSYYGNIPVELRFADADPAPPQVSPQEAWNILEAELLASIDGLSEERSSFTYGKVNKWVGYTILANLYLNSERITGIPKWQEAADAANMVINSGAYSLEGGYFANFRTQNESSSENIFVIPYERGFLNGFNVRHTALHQSADATFGMSDTPWGGFAIQEDFYNAFEDEDKRKGMFLTGQQYTIEAGPNWTNDNGFGYANPDPAFELTDCVEDFDNYLSGGFEDQLVGGCNIFITTDYNEIDNRYPYRHGARYAKFELALNETGDISNDFPIYRYAGVLLMRAEALWRLDNGSTEALALVNMTRARAGLDALGALTEDDLYWEIKKELALENHGRATTIRFGHWEDDWFLKGIGNQKGQPSVNFNEEFRRYYPIPTGALQANPSLQQNPGY